MQDYLCQNVNVDEFPETKKFIESNKNGTTRDSNEVAKDIMELAPNLNKMESGGYIDLRDLK